MRPLRKLSNTKNIRYLATECASIALVAFLSVGFFRMRAEWGLPWVTNIPVALLGIFLMGGLQHRLAGLAHEASHFCLFRNRVLNDLVSDFLCMFPIYATTGQYRVVHLAHHQFVNDWHRDPDLMQIGKSKLMDQFPMSRLRFIFNYYIRFFLPHVLLRYLWDVLYLSALGKGKSPYEERAARRAQAKGLSPKAEFTIRLPTLLGIGYLLGLGALLQQLNSAGMGLGVLLAAAGLATAIGVGVTALLPERQFFTSPIRGAYSSKTAAMLRVVHTTLLLGAFAVARHATGINFGVYYLVLWAIPLLTTFAYFMLLRDVYQHGNADQGRITNTRVFFCDPLTWWAVFVYGQGMHTPHHLYPAVPHYNLLKLHRLLQDHDPEYSEQVVECHGTFHNSRGLPTILDVMQPEETEIPAAASAANSAVRTKKSRRALART